MVGKTKAPTAAEKRRMDILKEHVPCIPCLLITNRIRLPDIQHTVSGMKRDGHISTYSSCPWHHRGHPLENWQTLDGHLGGPRQATMGLLGPSLAMGKRSFAAEFGPEALLVKIADFLVERFEEQPWMDYHVPENLRKAIREYWREKIR